MAAGAASWAHVVPVPGKPGSTGGAVNPEVRLHLHPPLSMLGKLQAQPSPTLLLHREGSSRLGHGLEERVLKAVHEVELEGLGVSRG